MRRNRHKHGGGAAAIGEEVAKVQALWVAVRQ